MAKFGHLKFKLPAPIREKTRKISSNVALDGRIKTVQEQRSGLISFLHHGDI